LGDNEKMGEDRIIRKTPAVTMVAECNNEDTGVGPSMASGNQVCRNNCADLAHAAINKKHAINDAK
jgi:hypothetical protein